MKKFANKISEGYLGESGYREVLSLAIPLTFGSGAIAIQQFVDRMFLAWYSPEAIAATMPAGIVYYTIMSLFTGTANYVSTFVAQYWGARKYQHIGSVLWQGMYISLIAGVMLLLMIPVAEPFFQMVGHAAEVSALETIYFQLLCLGAAPATLSAVLSGFYTGRGRTLPVMWVNFLGTVLNMLLNYLLIFGKLGLPAWGVFGAGVATVIATFFTAMMFLIMIVRPKHDQRFSTRSAWHFNYSLFARLLHYALPNGIQFTIEHLGFSAFILLIGRLGTVELAATNIAFNINMLAFMPMIGFGTAISVVVGQKLGKNRPDLSEKGVYSGLHLTLLYFVAMALMYLLLPAVFIWPFSAGAEPGSLDEIEKMVVILLRFIALYSLFDALNITFSSGVKGAGDTRFVMLMMVGFSLFGLTLPIYLALAVFGMGIYAAWTIITIYIAVLGLIFMFRFLGGKWKSMRVIDADSRTVDC